MKRRGKHNGLPPPSHHCFAYGPSYEHPFSHVSESKIPMQSRDSLTLPPYIRTFISKAFQDHFET